MSCGPPAMLLGRDSHLFTGAIANSSLGKLESSPHRSWPPRKTLVCINDRELIAQAAMILEWHGSEIREGSVPGVGHMSSPPWLIFGHARHGPAVRLQVGALYWISFHRLRISPLYLESSHNIPIDILTRPTVGEINQSATQNHMTRVQPVSLWR